MGPRLTTRRLLLAVVATALALAAWNEWHWRQVRTACAGKQVGFETLAARHERWQKFCLAQSLEGVPYDRQARQDALELDFGVYPSLAPDFSSWEQETRDHGVRVETYRKSVAEAAARRREAERHLIFRWN